MDIMKPRALRQEARRRLEHSGNRGRQLILLNSGVLVAMTLLGNTLNFLLNHQFSATGGLGGLGMRSVLQTVQTMLSYLIALFTPFWSAGLLFCFVALVRQETVENRSMLEGFRRFSKVLGFSLLGGLAGLLLVMPVAYAASMIYTFTPFASSFLDSVQGLVNSGALVNAAGQLDPAAIPPEVLLRGVLPLSAIMLVVAIPVFLWLHYSLHLGEYLIMTDSVRSCFQAFGRSMQMMRGQKMRMFKLDLSYWWYYLLEMIIGGILSFYMVAELLNLALPISQTAFYFTVLITYCVCELGLHLWKKAERDTAYALLYEQIADPGEALAE